MSKNSHKQIYTQLLEWRNMMVKRGAIKIKKRKKDKK